MHTSWPLLDIVALTFVRSFTAAHVLMHASTHSDLESALDGDRELFDALPSSPSTAFALREQAASLLDQCERCSARILTPFDTNYPIGLRTALPMPAVLFVRGVLRKAPCIGVVGTRRSTDGYGRPVTTMFVRTWSKAGATIVSGLATGIDTFAHTATLDAGGHTIAVVACGVDRVTPSSAMWLAERIIDHGGAIVSEYRCGMKAMPGYFPVRNRVITALSDAVVVVESAEKGGSMISADFATKQGRALYAVPGPITSTRSAGPNALIRTRQAVCLQSAEQLLDDLGLSRSAMLPFAPPITYSPIEQQIVQACTAGARTADALASVTGLAHGDILATLLGLEFRGLIRRLPGQHFELIS